MANTNFAKESFQGLPQWAKGIIAIAVVGGVAYLGYKLYDAITSGAASQKKEGREEKSELKDLIKSGNPPKLSGSQIVAMANQFKTAFDGIGHNFPTVIKLFNQIPTYSDLLAVLTEFGVKKINSGIYLVPDFEGTLPQVISNELNTYEIIEINKALAKKGIKYKF